MQAPNANLVEGSLPIAKSHLLKIVAVLFG
jgi:hypothetical protein